MENLQTLTKKETVEINGGIFGLDDLLVLGIVFAVGFIGGFLWEYTK